MEDSHWILSGFSLDCDGIHERQIDSFLWHIEAGLYIVCCIVYHNRIAILPRHLL